MIDSYLNDVPFEGFEDLNGKRHVYVGDLTVRRTRWSKSAVDYFNLPGEVVEDGNSVWVARIHPEDRKKYLDDVEQIFSGKKSYHNIDYRMLNKYGEYVAVTCIGRVIPSTDGKHKLFCGTVENHGISSRIDSVTGLYNVYTFFRDSSESWNHSEGEQVVLLQIGINSFSDVNKNYGYGFGNKLLKRFADNLRKIESKYDNVIRVYRMDGTKFCFSLVNTSEEDAKLLYDEIKKIAHKGYIIEGIHVSFTISGGVVLIDEKDLTDYSLQISLGYVLDESKHRKHGELVVYDNSNVSGAQRNLAVIEAIRNSVFNGMEGFYLCYQPIINVEDEKICGMEALLRWHDDTFGEVPPGIFIPWLENDPCFYELGNWVMKQALIDAKKLLVAHPDFVVNVNVSAEQIERSGFRQSVCDILDEVQFPTKNLCIELTERVVSLDLKFLRGELNYFRDMGIKVALDDFGTGVSSLNLLLELPVDYLKIDRNFVKDINTNKAEQMIVETIAFCAQGMDLDICVEGVETTEMKEFLKRYRIQKHQGYLYSKPVVYDQFVKLLA